MKDEKIDVATKTDNVIEFHYPKPKPIEVSEGKVSRFFIPVDSVDEMYKEVGGEG